MTLAQAAANAQATINGIAVTSASNSLDSVIDGITFNLAKVTTQPTTVSVTRDTDSIKTMVAGFVAAYNQLNGFLGAATHYDAATQAGRAAAGRRHDHRHPEPAARADRRRRAAPRRCSRR